LGIWWHICLFLSIRGKAPYILPLYPHWLLMAVESADGS
jgi:hypothetical protein